MNLLPLRNAHGLVVRSGAACVDAISTKTKYLMSKVVIYSNPDSDSLRFREKVNKYSNQHNIHNFLFFFAPLIAVLSHEVAAVTPSPVVAVVAISVRLTFQNQIMYFKSPVLHHLLNSWIWSRPSLFHISSRESAPVRSCLLARKRIGTPAK